MNNIYVLDHHLPPDGNNFIDPGIALSLGVVVGVGLLVGIVVLLVRFRHRVISCKFSKPY